MWAAATATATAAAIIQSSTSNQPSAITAYDYFGLAGFTGLFSSWSWSGLEGKKNEIWRSES